VRLASGARAEGLDALPEGLWGAAEEVSPGKDTPSGHWELAGLPVPWDWSYFPKTDPAFPDDIVAEVKRLAGVDGILGNCHASGTEIIARLGEEHERTGWPICYTSVDSVFQIAAHEQSFGLDRLLALCEGLAPKLHARKVGRVIARPFVGTPGHYSRTVNRRDYAITPPEPTLLDWVQAAGRKTYGIGKIRDIFAGQGVGAYVKGADADLMTHLAGHVANAEDGSLTFANFVEFDSLYGHRRDVSGYARHLEWFDAEIGPILAALARRPDALHRRSRQRSHMARHRPHAREGARHCQGALFGADRHPRIRRCRRLGRRPSGRAVRRSRPDPFSERGRGRMSSETIYFFMTLIVVTLAVRFIGPMMGRPRTPWRGSIIFGFIIAFIGWAIGT
jgi:phosphopentomutase